MSIIDKQSLRTAAENATPGEWCTDDYHGVIADAGLNANYYIASCSGPDNRSNKRFIAAANPATVLALLDELEAKEKSISFLKDQLAQLANFNPDWDKLEAATDSLREHMVELTAARNRIAELEMRPDTVKLPDEVIVLLNHLEDVLPCEAFNSIDVKTWNAVSRLAATGIRISGEG